MCRDPKHELILCLRAQRATSNEATVSADDRKRFTKVLFGAAAAVGRTVVPVRVGEPKSFDEYRVDAADGSTVWVLAHVVVPVFAVVDSVPQFPLVEGFVEPDFLDPTWFAPWELRSVAELEAPLTPFLRSRLLPADHRDIDYFNARTVGQALFNRWD